MHIKTRFSLKPVKGLSFTKASLTQAQFQSDTDINRLVRRYVSGDMSVLVKRPPIESDCTQVPDSFHECLNIAKRAEVAWKSLPDSVRSSFGSYKAFLDAYDAAMSIPDVVTPESEKDDGAKPATPAESAPTNT